MTQSTPEGRAEDQRIVVVGPDGQPMGVLDPSGDGDDEPTEGSIADDGGAAGEGHAHRSR